MPKNVLHDIMSKEQRSIRRVPLPQSRRDGRGIAEEDSILYEREEFQMEEPPPQSWRRALLWSAAFLFVVLLGFALSKSFTGATITVTPKAEVVEIRHEFAASRTDAAKLRFDALPIQEAAEVVIPADTTRKVVERASGTIVIYNNFSEKSQRLIKNTRFETADGLIYRIGNSVTVPGKAVKNGRVVPGSVEAAVTADAPGDEYNIPLSDFTVPGFKSDPARFAGFYARSKTPMTGGFDGTVTVPSDAAIKVARTSLQETVRAKIIKEKKALAPLGYVLFDGALAVSHESPAPEARGKGFSAIREHATGAAYLLNRKDLSKAIAAAALQTFNGMPVEIPGLETLTFELLDASSGKPAEAKTIRFTLQGAARIVWPYDEEKLRTALAGKSKDDLAAVLSAFPTIERVDLVLRPFWSRRFSENPKKLSVERVPPLE